MRKAAIFCSGVIMGIVGTKLVPKTKPVLFAKYMVEVGKAQIRLSKILHNEYWLLDEALNTENTFLSMIKPEEFFFFNVSFSLIDEDGQRRIHTAFVQNKKED